MSNIFAEFMGMRVIESPYLEIDGEPYQVRRTWRERWLTRPWHPFVRTRTVVPKIPNPGAVRLNAHTLVMHPQTWKALRAGFSRPPADPDSKQ